MDRHSQTSPARLQCRSEFHLRASLELLTLLTHPDFGNQLRYKTCVVLCSEAVHKMPSCIHVREEATLTGDSHFLYSLVKTLTLTRILKSISVAVHKKLSVVKLWQHMHKLPFLFMSGSTIRYADKEQALQVAAICS